MLLRFFLVSAKRPSDALDFLTLRIFTYDVPLLVDTFLTRLTEFSSPNKSTPFLLQMSFPSEDLYPNLSLLYLFYNEM